MTIRFEEKLKNYANKNGKLKYRLFSYKILILSSRTSMYSDEGDRIEKRNTYRGVCETARECRLRGV
jgi:hypothetical protein